jgi:hypothetical protein
VLAGSFVLFLKNIQEEEISFFVKNTNHKKYLAINAISLHEW